MFETRLAEVAGAVGRFLDAELAGRPDTTILQAMRYALTGGKRLRAFLVMESCRLHGIAGDRALGPAAAIEAMHAYSLVHDDLPSMDDDDLRRGQPTVHRKWDEATAVLTGDALQSLAFELVCRDATDPAASLRLAAELARQAGAGGMVQGQMMDIAAETAPQPLTLPEITELQARKTGALIAWSACCGPRLAGADDTALAAYAAALGLAFQIADDILDVEGDPARTGKAVRKDEAAGKATFVSLLGLEGARRRAADLAAEAEAALASYGADGGALRECARYVVRRDR